MVDINSLYCVAPGTTLPEKSIGEVSSALSAGVTRIGGCVAHVAGGEKAK